MGSIVFLLQEIIKMDPYVILWVKIINANLINVSSYEL